MVGDSASGDAHEQALFLSAALEAERERLATVQNSIRRVLAMPNLRSGLAEMSRALRAVGWREIIVTLLDEEGQPRTRLVGGEPVPVDAGTPVLPSGLWSRFQDGALESCRVGGTYVVERHCAAEVVGEERAPVVFAPLNVGFGSPVGVIQVIGETGDEHFSPDLLRPLDILAAQAAYMVENTRLLARASQSAEALEEQVEELSMIHRADRELSAHLNLERVMRLTMDWALRRTEADTGLLMLMTDDGTGLVPYIVMGHVDRALFPHDAHNPLPLTAGTIGLAGRFGATQYVPDAQEDAERIPFIPGARAHVSVPLRMRGEVLGVITLAAVKSGVFDEDVVAFLERLGRRAAVALDNARLYRQTEQLASDMAALYNAGRTITSTLNRDEILRRIARAMSETLECSSAVIFDYKPETQEVQVLAVHRADPDATAGESLPPLKHTYPLASYPAFQTVVEQQHSLALRADDLSLTYTDRAHLLTGHLHSMVLVPLVAQEELMGVAALIEGRYPRVFTANEVYKAEALAGQAAIALRQSLLFSEIQELETLKTEMIRMASHDLRNPLNNIMGYTELLAMSLEESGVTIAQRMYLENLRSSSETMRVLLEDLLTLERIESERMTEWQSFDLASLVVEVVESQLAGAKLKQQVLSLERGDEALAVQGSITHLRQAIANLVSNAIKYTPEGGHIVVSVSQEQGRVAVSVKDDGYGISPARQARIFERFYRAREPGTEHVSGTGLGLSLVKTVVERHEGRVWFSSIPGEGSVFGFWLPATPRLRGGGA
ncbi:MAG: GAF domain-containing sensor histidine kinase [Anaerolineae bacterium]|nr:GAF domain-containing sensor histidine kinase [Anaerolineae bacterium]